MSRIPLNSAIPNSTTPLSALSALALIASLGSACGDDASATNTEGASTDTDSASTDTDANTTGETETDTGIADGPTFWDDVAPIYFERCVSCHKPGGVGPFALDTYGAAQTWGPASAAATAARTMPPWLVRDDGTCGTFHDSQALQDEEIATIQAWVQLGMPEGSPRSDLHPPEEEGLGDGLSLKTPTFVPEIQGGPLSEFDEYRCFLVDPGLDADAFLTAYEVIPGTPEIVHHALAMPVDPYLDVGGGVTNLDVIEALEAESPDRDGWPCFGAAGDGVEINNMPVVWAPGQGVVHYPEGTGNRVYADDLMVIQIHYNLDRPELIGLSDSTEVRIELRDDVELEGLYLALDPFLDTLFDDEPAALAAGQAKVSYTWEEPIGDWAQYFGWPSMTIHGIFPHMHEYGQTLTVEVDPDGEGYECAADVPRWDFNWQHLYFLDKPVTLDGDGGVRVTCGYNTEAAEEPVLPGWGTGNEMCFVGLFVTP